MQQPAHVMVVRSALAWSLTMWALAAPAATASSDQAWTEFRTAVGKACTQRAAGVFDKPAVTVDPFGTEAHGIALISKGSRAVVCVYEKKTKRVELSGVMTLPPGALAAQTHPQRLIDCSGKPVAEPVDVVLTCADAGISAQRLSWSSWSEPVTTAIGSVSVNSCTPNCAAGTFSTYRIALIASGAKRCHGVLAYDALGYAFIGKSPPAQSSESITYGCR